MCTIHSVGMFSILLTSNACQLYIHISLFVVSMVFVCCFKAVALCCVSCNAFTFVVLCSFVGTARMLCFVREDKREFLRTR